MSTFSQYNNIKFFTQFYTFPLVKERKIVNKTFRCGVESVLDFARDVYQPLLRLGLRPRTISLQLFYHPVQTIALPPPFFISRWEFLLGFGPLGQSVRGTRQVNIQTNNLN